MRNVSKHRRKDSRAFVKLGLKLERTANVKTLMNATDILITVLNCINTVQTPKDPSNVKNACLGSKKFLSIIMTMVKQISFVKMPMNASKTFAQHMKSAQILLEALDALLSPALLVTSDMENREFNTFDRFLEYLFFLIVV